MSQKIRIKLKSFDIALRHEFTKISKYISSPSIQEVEQIKRNQNTVCTGWLKRKKQSTLFCQTWLTELENAYQIMHKRGETIYQQQLNSKTEHINSNQETIKNAFNDVIMIMSRAA